MIALERKVILGLSKMKMNKHLKQENKISRIIMLETLPI